MRFLLLALCLVAPVHLLAFGPTVGEGTQGFSLPESFFAAEAGLWLERDANGKLRTIARLIPHGDYSEEITPSAFQQRIAESVLHANGWRATSGKEVPALFGQAASLRSYSHISHNRLLATLAFQDEEMAHLLLIESPKQGAIDACVETISRGTFPIKSSLSRRGETSNILSGNNLELRALELPNGKIVVTLGNPNIPIPFHKGEVVFSGWGKQDQELHPFVTASAYTLSIRGGGVRFHQDTRVIKASVAGREIARATLVKLSGPKDR